jgi:hypothetical protein
MPLCVMLSPIKQTVSLFLKTPPAPVPWGVVSALAESRNIMASNSTRVREIVMMNGANFFGSDFMVRRGIILKSFTVLSVITAPNVEQQSDRLWKQDRKPLRSTIPKWADGRSMNSLCYYLSYFGMLIYLDEHQYSRFPIK